MDQRPVKAIGLVSGGLDSTLAVFLMRQLGTDIVALNVASPFCTCNARAFCGEEGRVLSISKMLDVPLVVHRSGREYIEIIKQPRFGYGKAFNPCQDCRVHTFEVARRVMEERGARFVFTGEVLGQRPMSQRLHQLHRIEKEAGLSGLIVRPLSARLLPPTVPEKNGWVDRSRLLDIGGRSRKKQLALAAQFQLRGHACPGGGCLLTETGFCAKLQDAFIHGQDSDEQLRLLRVGRHFRLDAHHKLIMGKDERENNVLTGHAGPGRVFFAAARANGPVALLDTMGERPASLEIYTAAASLVLRYADVSKDEEHPVSFGSDPLRMADEIATRACPDDDLLRYKLPEKLLKPPPWAPPAEPTGQADQHPDDVEWVMCATTTGGSTGRDE